MMKGQNNFWDRNSNCITAVNQKLCADTHSSPAKWIFNAHRFFSTDSAHPLWHAGHIMSFALLFDLLHSRFHRKQRKLPCVTDVHKTTVNSTFSMAAYLRQYLGEIRTIQLHLYIYHHELKSPSTNQQVNRYKIVFLWNEGTLDSLWDKVPMNWSAWWRVVFTALWLS